MIGDYVAADLDFSLFEPNVLSASSEKKLIELLLDEDFINDPWLQRRLSCYALADTVERDRIVLEIFKFFFQGTLPSELFAVVREFDSIFAVLGKRGHFVHQFEVLIFGWALIRMLIEHNKGIKKSFRFNSPKDIFFVWLMASVIHDFGYPLQVAEDVMKKFHAWYRALGMSEIAELFQGLIKNYEESEARNLTELKSQTWAGLDVKAILLETVWDSLKINRSSAEKLLKSIEAMSKEKMPKEKIHGYTGATILCGKCLQSWQTSGLTAKALDYNAKTLKLALAAICLHDLPNDLDMYIRKIDFWRNPYAYLLFLIDNLQDWFRNLRPNEEWPSYNLLKIGKTENRLELSYILTHENWTKDMEDSVKGSVRKKFGRLKMMTKPNPPLHFQIAVDFRTSHGQQLGAEEILL
jgi:hypothetical protein